MSAHLVEIVLPRCSSCGRPAKVEVVNTRNARVGTFCRPCGNRRLKGLRREEQVTPGSFREESLRRPLES